MQAPVLTARLLLRLPSEQDGEAIMAIAGDWEVARRLARLPHPYTEADLRFFFDHVLPNGIVWAIVWRTSGRLIGMIGLTPAPDGNGAELGYYIARDQWGCGVATEAATAITRVAFKSLGYRKLTSGYFKDNPASGRVLAKAGFIIVGSSRRSCLAENRDKPSVEVECAASA